MLFEALVARFNPMKSGGGQGPARQTFAQSLAVANVESDGFEMTRAGRRFYIGFNGSVPTGIAPVQALPTTAAQWAITNNDPNKSFAFDSIGVIPISGTPGVGGTLLGTVFQTPVATGASATGTAITNASGSAASSNAVIKSGVTITTPAVPVWSPLAFNQPGAVGAGVAGNSIINEDLRGRLVLPPGWSLGLAVLALAGTTPLFIPFGCYVQIETDLE